MSKPISEAFNLLVEDPNLETEVIRQRTGLQAKVIEQLRKYIIHNPPKDPEF